MLSTVCSFDLTHRSTPSASRRREPETRSLTTVGLASSLPTASNSSGISIRANSIFANGGKGIDLTTSFQATQARNPVLTGATVGPQTRIVGQINPGSGGTTYIIDFFASDKANPSGFGDGQIYLGSTLAIADGSPGFTHSTSCCRWPPGPTRSSR